MFPILFRRIRKSLFVILPLALLAGYAVHDAYSHYDGVLTAGYAAIPGGCGAGAPGTCHGPEADATTLIHLYTPSTIIAGNTYTLTFSVANPNPQDVAAGFDIDVDTPASLGMIPGTNTVISNPDTLFGTGLWSISHSIPQQFNVNGANSDSAVWSFQYTARPTAGVDILYLAGNAVNGDSAIAGDSDRWNQSVAYITVQAASSVAQTSSASALQVYPNPASNELFINDGIPADEGSYTLTDAAGRVVLFGHHISLDGNHNIDVSTIGTGTYILSVQPRNGSSFSKSIVIQK